MKIIRLLLVFLSFNSVAQGPWVQGKNKGYFQLGGSGLYYDKSVVNNKVSEVGNKYYDLTAQLYSEYGLTNKLDAVLIVPLKFLGFSDSISTKTLNALGNITAGLKYSLYDKKIKMSIGLNASLNTISKNKDIGLRSGFDAYTFFPYVTVGGSKNKFYYFLNLGYGLMTNDYNDFVQLYGEIGYKLGTKIYLIANIDWKEPFSNESFYKTDAAIYAISANYLDRQQYFSFGLKANYEFVLDKYGVNAGIGSGFFLNNLPFSPSINLAIYRKI